MTQSDRVGTTVLTGSQPLYDRVAAPPYESRPEPPERTDDNTISCIHQYTLADTGTLNRRVHFERLERLSNDIAVLEPRK